MKSAFNIAEWLRWLGRVRFLVITFLVVTVVAVRVFTPIPFPVRSFVPLIALWYSLAVTYVVLPRWIPRAAWHVPLQMVGDLLVITGVVYATGAQDSYFVSLYLLAILMGSVLFSRRGVFLVAGACFALLGSVIELAFYGVIPPTANSMPSSRAVALRTVHGTWVEVSMWKRPSS